MVMPLSWKIGASAVGVIVLIVVWNLGAEYYAQHQANEVTQQATRAAEQDAQQAQARARQYHVKLAQKLKQQREDRYNNYQQINDQARKYQKAEAIRLETQHQEKLRVEASYMLASNQQCLGGIVINRQGASFSQATGQNGHQIACNGRKAAERLR